MASAAVTRKVSAKKWGSSSWCARIALSTSVALVVLLAQAIAQLDVRTLVLVGHSLAHVVQHPGALDPLDVEAHLGGHVAGEEGNLLGVLELVLAVRGTEAEPAERLDDLRVHVVDSELVQDLLGSLHHALLDLGARLLHHLLDAPRMDASVLDETLERDAGRLTPHRIEGGEHHRLRRIVDDDVHTGRLLEGPNVATFASDDASLHLVGRKLDDGHRGLGRVVGREALNGEPDDLLGFAVRVTLCLLPDLTQGVRRVGPGFVLEVLDELLFRLACGHARELLEALARLLPFLGDATRLFGQGLVTPIDLEDAALQLLLSFAQALELPVERVGALLETTFGSFGLFAPTALFLLPGLPETETLLASGQLAGFAEVFRFLLGPFQDTGGFVLGLCSFQLAAFSFPTSRNGRADQASQHKPNDRRRQRNDQRGYHVSTPKSALGVKPKVGELKDPPSGSTGAEGLSMPMRE